MRASLLAVVPLLLFGCTEPDPSTNPDDTDPVDLDPTLDSDGDRLPDVLEAELGTDPLNPDTDGDSYTDAAEVESRSDPLDGTDLVYTGRWPYNLDKNFMDDPGVDGPRDIGARLPRRTGRDQYGDIVDLYDFANQGKPVVIDTSALWCAPCQAMATWMETGVDPLPASFEFDRYKSLRDAVEAGDVYWITLISDAVPAGTPPTLESVQMWAEEFPSPNIPVIIDRNQGITRWSETAAYPSIMLLDENLEILAWDPGNWNVGMQAGSELVSQ